MRRWWVVATVATVLALPQGARADDTVVVAGTSFPAGSTYLTYFGCVDLYHADTRGPQVRVHLDDATPAGRRATELQLPGSGTASGPVSLVTSVARTASSLSVRAPSGAAGVAWVWYAAGDLEPGQVWAGRADLHAAAGGWQRVTPAEQSFTWTRYDTASGTALEQAGSASIADFSAAHGDGPGYLLAGFGCDGAGFNLDAVSVGLPGSVTTYDLEGLPVQTSMAASRQRIRPGEPVTLTGSSVDALQRVTGAPLVLEQRVAGHDAFTPVGDPVSAGPDGHPTVEVEPEMTTDYRWHYLQTGYADEGWSAVVRVTVAGPADR